MELPVGFTNSNELYYFVRHSTIFNSGSLVMRLIKMDGEPSVTETDNGSTVSLVTGNDGIPIKCNFSSKVDKKRVSKSSLISRYNPSWVVNGPPPVVAN